MGIRESGFINSVSTSFILLLLLSLGLYIVAMNPRLAGFDVQANPTASTTRYVSQGAQSYPAAQDRLITSEDFWGQARHQTSTQNAQCDRWYRAQKGDTQWDLAAKYASESRWQWIRSMRQVSGKALNDDQLIAGERICVEWN